jgi:hypothetical protein
MGMHLALYRAVHASLMLKNQREKRSGNGDILNGDETKGMQRIARVMLKEQLISYHFPCIFPCQR